MSKIEVNNLTKTYGSTLALDKVNLCFEGEKIYGLLGRNGAGKTTLLSLLSNRIFPSNGQIFINDMDILNDCSKVNEIYCTTEKVLYPESMKIHDLIKWTNEFYVNFDRQKAMDLSGRFGINLNNRMRELSTGYRTIVKDILALAANTPVILFDEPVLGLDANHRDMFYKELIQCQAEKPRTIVISTHLIDEIEGVIEQLVILDKGKIIVNDDIDNIMQKSYIVSGPAASVDEFIKHKNVIGLDKLGGLEAAYLFNENMPRGGEAGMLDISMLPLQKLFINLTDGGAT